jgi:hypothetical protein
MSIVDVLQNSNVFQTTETVNPMDNEKPSNWQSLESMIDDTRDSISPITIPLVSSQPILAVSPKYILVNEYTKKRKRLIIIDDNLKRLFINSSITETIIDAVWYDIDKKFFLLTERKIFTFDPNSKTIETISDIKSDDNKPFKSFTVINNQSSLLIGYDEWESKFIDRWQQDNKDRLWKLIERYPLNLTSNEFIGNILAINEDDCSNLAITIYNNLTEQWRMELRHAEMFTCFKTILLSGSNPMYDYRIIAMKTVTSDIKWLAHSQANNEVITIDSKWKKIHLYYKYPVYRIVQFKQNNLIVRTKNRVDILLFI